MPKSPQFLAKRLRSEGEKMTAFFAELSDTEWQKTIYTEGETWTIRNVLAHFVTAEQGFLRLFAEILDGSEGVPSDFDIDRYNARQQEKVQEYVERLQNLYPESSAAKKALKGEGF